MKSFFISLVFSFLTIQTYSQVGWNRKTDLNSNPRYGAISGVIGNKAYVGTGNIAFGIVLKDFWEYNPINDMWTQKADFAGGSRYQATSVVINNKMYVGLGFDEALNYRKDWWEYEPSTNNWVKKADFPGNVRSGAIGFGVNGKAYVGLGHINFSSTPFQDFWEYSPMTDTWKKVADFPPGVRTLAIGFGIADKGYVGTGQNTNGLFKDFWEYTPSTNTWKRLKDFQGDARSQAVGISLCNNGYILTGSSSSGYLKDFWRYEPITDTWTHKPDLIGDTRRQSTAFAVNNRVYITTGHNGTFYKDIWEYDYKLDLGGDLTPCTGKTIQLTAPDNFNSYLWSNGSTNASINVNQSGKYWVKTTTDCEILTDTIQVTFEETGKVDLGNDKIICNQSSALLDAGMGFTAYEWNDGSKNQTLTTSQSGTYVVKAFSGECYATDTIQVKFVNQVAVNLGDNQILKCGEQITLNAGNGYDSYTWQDGSHNSTLTVTQPGRYIVEVKSGICSAKDTIDFYPDQLPIINLGATRVIDCGEEVVLEAGLDNWAYIWNNGSTNSNITINQAGVYTLTVKKGYCTTQGSIEIKLIEYDSFIPNVFTPNQDNYNEYFYLPDYLKGSKLSVFNRWGVKIYESASYQNNWDGGNLPVSTYYYLIEHQRGCLKSPIKGWVSIMR